MDGLIDRLDLLHDEPGKGLVNDHVGDCEKDHHARLQGSTAV